MPFAIPPYIDPNARGTQYVIPYAYHIYTTVRHQTPLQGHRVTGSQGRRPTEPQDHQVPGSRGHWVIGSLGHWVTRVTWSLGYQGHWVIESPSPYLPNAPLLGSPGTRVTQPSKHPGNQVSRLPGLPKYQGHGSPGLPNHPTTQVPGYQGNQAAKHPSIQVTG
jgi:hypothetical protein